MPRYYFDVDDGEKATLDDQGLELQGIEAAQKEAVRTLPQIGKDVLPDGTEKHVVVTVRNEAGQPIIRATLSLTVERLA
jgi:hypothetical protein